MTETATISVPDLIAVLRRSALVDDQQLKKSLQGVDLQSVQSDDVAQLLVEAKLLTPWQVKQVLKGRYKGYRLGKYLLLGELGRGGMAKVFLARHETLLNHVAIKVLARHRLAKPSMIHRFLREARAAAQLSHPNIVRVYDVDAEEDRNYLVMEYIRGRSVQDMVDEDGPLSFDRAVRFTQHAALGLAAAHRHGLIHRDVKPANLLVEDDRLVKLSDFGLARAGGEEDDDAPSLTMQHDEKVLGTADYIAPEQAINSHAIDERADLYSLGYTLYYMLTGQPPFPTGRIVERLTKHCTVEPPSIRTFRPDVPESLLEIVHKLTRKSAEERYRSADAVAEALGVWLADPRIAGASFAAASSNRWRSPVAPSSERASASSSLVDDELELAPDDDHHAAPACSSSTTASAGSAAKSKRSPGGPAAEEPLPQLDDAALIDDLGESGSLIDELLDQELSTANSGTMAKRNGATSDVHGSDVRSQSLDEARRETTTSRAMATSVEQPTAPRPAALARLQERMRRGEYPLWLLIFAGLVFGGILAWIAVGYFSANKPLDVPSFRRMEN